MPILYQAIKNLARIARYPLAHPLVINAQQLMLPQTRSRRVSLRISPRDEMYLGGFGHYYAVGMSGIECIEEALARAGNPSPRSVLDLPCGHGRVLRFLVERFPDARFTACDLDRNGAEFCASVFGARPVVSRPDIDTLTLEERFDLIWCGSLLTHLDERRSEALLRFFHRHLEPGGLGVFSAHGERAVELLRRGKLFAYGLSRADAQHALDSYTRRGFGYADYDSRHPGYGVSFSDPSWIRTTLGRIDGLREVYFAPAKWGNHHDVYGVVRT